MAYRYVLFLTKRDETKMFILWGTLAGTSTGNFGSKFFEFSTSLKMFDTILGNFWYWYSEKN